MKIATRQPASAGVGRYHHGELRRAAIQVGRDMVGRGELADLSLRAVAAEVGVSPTALYRHFADRRTLLAAVATVGFEQLRTTLVEASRAQATPAAELHAACFAYLDFAQSEPGIYRLIFEQRNFGTAEDGALLPAALSAFAALEVPVAACIGIEGEAAHRRATALWAALHGAAVLRQVGLLPVGRPADADERMAAARDIAHLIASALTVVPDERDRQNSIRLTD